MDEAMVETGAASAAQQHKFSAAALAWAAIGAVLVATSGGWALAGTQLWAFSYLIFVPLPLRLLLATLVLLAGLPWARTALAWLAVLLARAPRWFWPLITIPVFWLLRERTLHGDGLYKLNLLSAQSLTTDPYVWKEPLDSAAEYGSTALARQWGIPPEWALPIMSVIAGVIFVVGVMIVTQRLAGGRPAAGLFVAGALMGLGSTLLWFGHTENYSWVTAFLFLALALGLSWLAGRGWLASVGLLAGLALSFHPQAGFAVPALAALPRRPRWWRQAIVLGVSLLAAPAATVLLFRALGVPWTISPENYAGNRQLFWTPAEFLQPQRIVDILNNLWLVIPLLPLWAVTGVWAAAQRRSWRDRRFVYLTIAALGMLFYFFAFKSYLPRPQDWDLFAVAGPVVTLWGVFCWLLLVERRGRGAGVLANLAAPALVFAIVVTGAWIGVNHANNLLRPDAGQRDFYLRFRDQDLIDRLPQATYEPHTPICQDASGCERVAVAKFVMPQNGDERPVIFAHAPAKIVMPLQVPAGGAFLWLSPALDPQAWDWGGDGVTFRVAVRQNGQEKELWLRHLTPANPADRAWQEAFVPLDDYGGQQVELVLETGPGPAGNTDGDRAGWGMPWLMRGTYDGRFAAATP